jgi:hypothetical protein
MVHCCDLYATRGLMEATSMRLRRRRVMRPRRRHDPVVVSLVGACFVGIASAAVAGELIGTASPANISGVLLSLCLLTVASRPRQ